MVIETLVFALSTSLGDRTLVLKAPVIESLGLSVNVAYKNKAKAQIEAVGTDTFLSCQLFVAITLYKKKC
ncbi:hypothetical protein MRBL20_000843 [Peribacillus frigoritolerans]